MEDTFDVSRAMAQIAAGFAVKIRRLTEEDIILLTRPKKRQAKKRYHFLSFDLSDEEDFFDIAASNDADGDDAPLRRRMKKSKSASARDSEETRRTAKHVETPKNVETPSTSIPNTVNTLDIKSELPTDEVDDKPPKNSLIGKIRIKTAAELGSTVIFLDSDDPPGKLIPRSTITKVTPQVKIVPANVPQDVAKPSNCKLNIGLIAELYTKFFTPQNQMRIKHVAECIQQIAENIKNNTERIQEITGNKELTDSQKLMRRYSSFQEFKRNQEASERKLKEKFQLVMQKFDEENFEILFQLFFLGILKILIVSVSNVYKKGTLFKKLLQLLGTSLANSNYQNDRVFRILKSKDFRDQCISLVQFIEKYSRTELFGMLFLSDADKKMIGKGSNDSAEEGRNRQQNGNIESSASSSLSEFLTLNDSGEKASNSYASKTYGPAVKNHVPTSKPNVTTITVNSAPYNSSSIPSSNVPRPVNNFSASSASLQSQNNARIVQNKPYQINTYGGYGNIANGASPNVVVRSNAYGLNNSFSFCKTNNENINPGFYVDGNFDALKKTPGIANQNLRFLLTNNTPTQNDYNYAKYLEEHGRSALGLEPSGREWTG